MPRKLNTLSIPSMNVLKIKTEFDLSLSNEGQCYNQQIYQIRLETCYNGHIVTIRPSTLFVTLPNGDVFYQMTCVFIVRARPDLRKTFPKSSNLKKR